MTEGSFFKAISERNLHGAYLLTGEEEYSKNKAVSLCRNLVQEGTRDLNVSLLRNADFSKVKADCESLPFFDEFRIVILEDSSSDTDNALVSFSAQIPGSTILLIKKKGTVRKDNALYKALSKEDRVISFEPYDEENALKFLGKRAKENGIPLSSDTGRHIIRLLGTDLAGLENALLKLDGYAGHGNPVSREAVDACITPNPEYSIFKIIDCFLSGNLKNGLSMLQTEFREGRQSVLPTVSLIESRVRLMLTAKQMLLKKIPQPEILSVLGGSSYGNKMVLQSAQKCSLKMLVTAVSAFADADRNFKQGICSDNDALLLAIYQSFLKE